MVVVTETVVVLVVTVVVVVVVVAVGSSTILERSRVNDVLSVAWAKLNKGANKISNAIFINADLFENRTTWVWLIEEMAVKKRLSSRPGWN